MKLQKKADMEFDSKYGVNTAGIIPISNLNIKSNNWIHSSKYQAIPYVDFGSLLEPFDLPYEDFIFVDLGSGKGRAILMASSLPFKKIVGVEFSKELASIAEDNLSRYSEDLMNCKNIEMICMDATKYIFPEDPLVLYLYNPFDTPVMAHVVNNIAESFQKKPRRIVVLYFTPQSACVEFWDNVKFLEKVKASNELCIYDTVMKIDH
ncbi:MAG: class I SAM-dependent methyltransferase [Nitrospirota bacterium]